VIDWVKELSDWRKTRKDVRDAKAVEESERERLETLLQDHGHLRKDSSISTESVDSWLRDQVADWAVASMTEPKK